VAGAADARVVPAQLDGFVVVGGGYHPVAADDLLGLGERPVGGHDLAVVGRHDPTGVGEHVGQAGAALRAVAGGGHPLAPRDDPPGPYQLQAAIASVHANAARPEDTRWHDIARLYDGLVVVAPTPVFRLNRAVAYSMTAGPEEALAQVDALAGLDTFHLFHATRADLLRRLDRPAEAEAAYRTALTLTTNEAERRHLERRIGECGQDRPGSDDAAGYLT
jgi:hypothetical protein